MKLAQAFRDRHWGAVVALTLVLGPFLGFLYLGRGRRAFVYGIVEALCVVAAFAVGVRFNLFGPSPGTDLGGTVYIAIAPVRIAAAIQAARLARDLGGIAPRPWFARLGVLIVIALVLIIAPRLAAAMVRAIWLEPNEMMTGAMAPTIRLGDHVFVDKRYYLSAEPVVGDVVMVRDQDGISYLRRIAALRDGLFTVAGEAATDRPLTVPRSAIVGKVTIIFWSAATQRWQWESPR